MRTISFKPAVAMVITAVAFFAFSCNSEEEIQPNDAATSAEEVPAAVLSKLEDLCLGTEGIKIIGEGEYLIENDIAITEDQLFSIDGIGEVEGPNGEHYRHCNLVSCRNIRVYGTGLSSTQSTALDWAIANYNRLGLCISFTRVYSGSYDIRVRQQSGGAGGVAGFPYGDGRPYNSVTIYSGTDSYGTNVVEHVMTHELGHCIGFRHTDWFNRSLSCGSGGSESSSCAIHIPGTPTGTDRNSIMQSCFGAGEDGEFGGADVTALNALY